MKGVSPEDRMYVIPFAGFVVFAIHRSPFEIRSAFHGIILVSLLDYYVVWCFDFNSGGGGSS